jgi:uncharacterized membrane protein YccC
VNDSTPEPPRPGKPTDRPPPSGAHSSGRAFWRILTSFDHGAMVPLRTSLRNSVVMVLSLTLGAAAATPFGGPAAGCGALFVSYSDASDPYRRRALRMIAAGVTIALAGLLGGLSAQVHAGTAVLAALLAFIVGMAAAYGKTAMEVGSVSLVMFTIFSGQPFSSRSLLDATLLALMGGLLQVALSVALWPVRRYEPERQALALLYRDLGRIVTEPIRAGESPPVTARASQVHQFLRSSPHDADEENLRYQSLLNQAERARLCLITLLRMHTEIAAEAPGGDAEATLARFLHSAGHALTEIGNSLAGDVAQEPRLSQRVILSESIDAWRLAAGNKGSSPAGRAMKYVLHQMDALAGQLRAAQSLVAGLEVELASVSLPTPQRSSAEGDSFATTFHANLNFRSTVFRHALRLSLCLSVAGLLAAATGWRHSYWIPMTVILVLRPDFAATFSRGLQRIAGTVVGLLGATALFYCLPPIFAVQAMAIGLCVFFLRRFGHANYFFLALCVTAAIVLMLGLSGAAPHEVVPERLAATLIGGTLALSAYALWPTREPADDALAKLLAAYRDYFTAAAHSTVSPQSSGTDRPRLAARLARSNLEASIERLAAEPATTAITIDLLRSMIASSHRLAHAIMGIDAAHMEGTPPSARSPGAERFVSAVQMTFLGLEAALLGSRTAPVNVPDLRDAFHAMSVADDQHPGSLRLQTEGDTLVNSLNTLSEQILRWRDSEGSPIR